MKKKLTTNKNKKKMNTSTKIVIIAFLLTGSFTVCTIILNIHGITVSDILIEWVFKFFGLEMLAISGIKISKSIGSAFGKAEEAIDGILNDFVDGDSNDDISQETESLK